MIEAGKFLQQRYRIDKQIGQGGMGAVYVATDERFGSTVAIKETLCMDENFRKAIEREARLLNSLKHAALPRVSDHFEEDNGQFLVMEYIPGEDVASMLEANHASFNVEQILKWADQLLDALDYLHNQVIPVIHRDIKPQNLKIGPRGEMILLDFGLAKGNPTDASHQTAAKSIFGYSKNYASLEQIQGTGTDPRSDLYSLAATLYHLLTKQPPEDALTRAMAVLSRKPDPLVPANELNPDVPRGVAGVLQTAMDLDAAERPASAADMRQMLREPEKYAHLADPVTVAATGTNAQAFAEVTKLMPGQTGAVKQSDVKTEVMPGFVSQATAVRQSSTETSDSIKLGRGRRFAVATAALSLLLVAGGVTGGIYIVNPAVFGVESPSSAGPAPVTADTGVQPVSDAEPLKVGSEVSVSANVATNTQPTEAEKPAETTRTKPTAKQKNESESRPTSDSDTTANTVVETPADDPKNVYANPMRPPNVMRGAPPEPFRPPPGIDWSKLTPAQRQRVMEAMRRGRLPINRPLPRPTPPD